jgi:hypothetical protein
LLSPQCTAQNRAKLLPGILRRRFACVVQIAVVRRDDNNDCVVSLRWGNYTGCDEKNYQTTNLNGTHVANSVSSLGMSSREAML